MTAIVVVAVLAVVAVAAFLAVLALRHHPATRQSAPASEAKPGGGLLGEDRA